MNSDFATKLRLTATVLGCTTHKELCGRFRDVNPATHCAVDRMNKWLQGRALPRSARLYDDWAKVLGTQRSGAWLASCTVDAFLAEICGLFDADPQSLLTNAWGSGRAASLRSRDEMSYLAGVYAAYSLAWSPYHLGSLIRGTLRLEPHRTATFAATYSEQVLGDTIQMVGEAEIAGRMICALLRGPASASLFFLCLSVPGPPARAISGILTGASVLGQDSRPTTGRMALIRVPDGAKLEMTNRYLDPAPGAIAADLDTSGVPLVDPAQTDALIRGFLLEGPATPGIDKIPASLQTQLTASLDRSYVAMRGNQPG
jgi:hypothetical protein